jgi:hypothetical protein
LHLKIGIERDRIMAEAALLAQAQAERRALEQKPIDAAKVCDRLIAAAKEASAKPKKAAEKAGPPPCFHQQVIFLAILSRIRPRRG